MWTKAIRDLREGRGGVVATSAVAVAAAAAYLVIGIVRGNAALAVGGPVIMIGYLSRCCPCSTNGSSGWVRSGSTTSPRC
jgi:hypothetical protein